MSADHDRCAPTAPPSSGSAATCACATSRRSSPPPSGRPARPRAVRARPGAARPVGARPGGPCSTAACARSTRASAGGCSSSAATRPTSCRGSRPRSTRGRCTSPPTSGPTGAPATRPSRRRSPSTAASSCAPARRTRSRPAGSPSPTARPTRCSPRSAGPGSATAGARPPTPTPAPSRWIDPADKHGGPRRVQIPDDDRRRGRAAARRRGGRAGPLAGVPRRRRRPATSAPATVRTGPARSRMSAHLKYGTVHPRTLLADLAGRSGEGADTLRSELAWREFYADVLWHRPDSARGELRPPVRRAALGLRRGGRRPLRRLGGGPHRLPDRRRRDAPAARDGWVHNRVRMIVASFLVKDLHLPWKRGARHFMQYLADGDLASNQHGWQWVAGTGTDAAPFFRRVQPGGRRARSSTRTATTSAGSCRSCATCRGKAVHRPWELPGRAAERLPRPDRGPRRGAPGGAGPVRAGQGPFGLTADGPVGVVPTLSAQRGGAA